nr:hypothetical protein CFP56_61454 [Quercus suber]
MGEGLGTHDSSKKTMPVSKCSGEVGGALPRADGGSNVVVGARNTYGVPQNRFSPLSKLVFDYVKDDILLLNWVNPTGSVRAEEDRNALDFAPLA